MTWLSALSAWQWVVLGLVPPLIIMLYFLKLRRVPLEVPSTYLWTRTIEDMHVNSIWQKLRNSLLLFLQLMVVLFLALALLRPGCQGDSLEGEYFIFLIDNSASMSATDTSEAENRLEDAKEQVQRMIDQLEPDDKAMIISFSNASRVVQSYTQKKSQLRKQLKSITQTERSTDIREALQAAAALANPGRSSVKGDAEYQVADAVEAQLHIFTDGVFPNIQDFGLGNLQAQYHPIGSYEVPNNVGIIAFSISDDVNLTGKMQAFAQLINSGEEEKTVTIEFELNGELVDAKSITIRATDTQELAFPLTAFVKDLEETARVKLSIKEDDDFVLDNVAYNVVNPPRPARVLIVTEQNPFLEMALDTGTVRKMAEVSFENHSFLDEKAFKDDAELGLYDLIVFDQCAPDRMPECSTVFINAVPKDSEWSMGEPQFPTLLLDFNTTHPVMASISMSRIQIAESSELTGPKSMNPLLESTFGTLIGIAPRGGFEDLVISFPLVEHTESGALEYNTDWGSKLSFPLFVQNVLEVLGGGARYQALKTSQPGELVEVRTQIPFPAVNIEDPEGSATKVARDKDGTYVYSQAEKSGIYRVEDAEDNEQVKMFAVNLTNASESQITVRDKLEIGFEEIKGTAGRVPVRHEYWTWFALTALLILIVEWLVYNRRVFI